MIGCWGWRLPTLLFCHFNFGAMDLPKSREDAIGRMVMDLPKSSPEVSVIVVDVKPTDKSMVSGDGASASAKKARMARLWTWRRFVQTLRKLGKTTVSRGK